MSSNQLDVAERDAILVTREARASVGDKAKNMSEREVHEHPNRCDEPLYIHFLFQRQAESYCRCREGFAPRRSTPRH